MMSSHHKKSISGLAAGVLLALFAAGILSVLLGGAGIYSRLVRRDRLAYDSRTCAQYIATKVRQAASSAAVDVVAFGDGDALIIGQTTAGAAYQTTVYCHDGWLMELFAAADGQFAPQDGEKLLPADRLSLTREKGLLWVEITQGDNLTQLQLFLPGEEAAP